MSNKPVLPLGLMDDGRLVTNPYPDLSRLVIGASGSAKTTTVVMNTAQALFGYPDIACLLNDPKNGECYAQLRNVARKTGRRFGCVDDFGVYGFDNPDRIRINPYGSILAALKHSPQTVNFSIETATHAHIPEVNDGRRNFHFRERPRGDLHLGMLILAEFKPDQLTPGGLCDMMSNPQTWRLARETAVVEGSPALKARACASLQLEDDNPEEYSRHYQAAVSALKIYEAGSVLNLAGADSSLTHEEICRGGWIVCFIQPQVHAERVGMHYALHQQSFLEAQYSGRGGTLHNIIDEMTNSPQKKAVDSVTIQRSYKVASDYIAQTLADIEKSYGQKEAAILADNCAVKQFLSFNEADAQRVSKLMGEEISIQRSMSVNAERLEVSGSLSTGKQPVMTPDELLNLDPAYQVIYLKGYGWLVCKKLYQNQVSPTCYWLGANPQEGAAMPPDPKVELPVHYCQGAAS